MADLDQKLTEYGKSKVYPLHMPGHKRQPLYDMDPFSMDITEIYDFDNLNHPESIYQDLNQRIAALYGADHAHLMVNGSTGGNYVMLHAATDVNDTILVARNCHKSIYHMIEMRQLNCVSIEPAFSKRDEKEIEGNPLVSHIMESEIPGPIDPQSVEKILKTRPEIKAFILTSPTYEGISSDIPSLARICHANGCALLVDAAHGAHFMEGALHFPRNPIALGADLAVVSFHKTLPALTQTAAVLVAKDSMISDDLISRIIPYHQTSSPSYVLTSSVAACVRDLEENRSERFSIMYSRLEDFYREMKGLTKLMVYRPEHHDPSKILVYSPMGGADLMRRLRNDYAMEAEYAVGHYILCMMTISDQKEGYDRLKDALWKIDQELEEVNEKSEREFLAYDQMEDKKQEVKLYEVGRCPSQKVNIEDAVGEIAAEQLAIYPPGIPTCLPGEKITEIDVQKIKNALFDSLEVDGIDKNGQIRIILK